MDQGAAGQAVTAAPPLSIAEINSLSADAFVARFGDIAENSPWVAVAAEPLRPFADRGAMIAAFTAALAVTDRGRRLALLRAHPDLAGRAAIAGDLGTESKGEQAQAGLDHLTRDEFDRFIALNDGYRSRHGIPFILAVKGATKDVILAAFAARMGNPPEAELETALAEVARIIRFRLEARVAGPDQADG